MVVLASHFRARIDLRGGRGAWNPAKTNETELNPKLHTPKATPRRAVFFLVWWAVSVVNCQYSTFYTHILLPSNTCRCLMANVASATSRATSPRSAIGSTEASQPLQRGGGAGWGGRRRMRDGNDAARSKSRLLRDDATLILSSGSTACTFFPSRTGTVRSA